MAEVGVLNLKIHAEDSAQATQSLRQLAGALQRVRNAVKGGINLSGVGTSIERFTTKVKENLNDSVMNQIGKLGEVLGKLNNLSNVTINIRGGNIASVRQSMEGTKEAAAKFSEDLTDRLEEGMSKLELLREKTDILRGELNEGIAGGAFDDKQIVNYALQIVNLENQIKGLEEIEARAGEAATWSDMVEGADTISMYAVKLSDLTAKMREGIESGKWDAGKIASTAIQITNLRSKLDQLKEKANSGTLTVIDEEAKAAAESFMDTTSKADLLERQIESLKTKLGQGIINGTMDDGAILKTVSQIERAEKQYEKLTDDIKNATDGIRTVDEQFDEVTDGISTSALDAKTSVDDLIHSLNHPSGLTEYKGFNTVIDRMMGIGSAAKRAKNYVAELEELFRKQDAERMAGAREGMAGFNYDFKKINEEFRRANPYANEKDAQWWAETVSGAWKENVEEVKKAMPTDLTKDSVFTRGLLNEEDIAVEQEAARTGETIEEVVQRIRDYKSTLDEAKPSMEGFVEAMSKIDQQSAGTEKIDALMDYSQIDLMTMKLNSMKDALYEDMSANKLDNAEIADRIGKIQDLSGKIDKLKESQHEATTETHRFRDALNSIKEAAVGSRLGKMVSQFERIIKLRAMRYIIKEIAAGFKEGTENVYQYSKAIGSDFYQSMDSAASAMLQMKNSIGAAAAPVIQMLIPYLQQAVNWFINLVNYANQFFALLNGQATWTQAVPATTSAFNDQANAAHGAANAVKDLLADWDELNIIQSETGGGGGGASTTAAEDYLNMFQEVATFDNRIKKIFDFIRENLDKFKVLAAGVGAALLGWKLSSAFMETLPWLANIGTGLSALGVITISLALTDITGQAFAQTGSVGWFLADALGGAVGAELAGELVKKLAGGAAGTVTKGFTLILEGIINIKNAYGAAVENLMGRAWALAALGSLQTGIGAALAATGFGAGLGVSLATGVVTGVATLTIAAAILIEAHKRASYRKMAIDAFEQTGTGGLSAQDYIDALQKRLDELTTGSQLIVDIGMGVAEHSLALDSALASIQALNGSLQSGQGLSRQDAEEFKQAWDIVIAEMGEIAKINYETIYKGLDEAITHGSETIREQAIELKRAAIEAEGIMNGARGQMAKELEYLENTIFTGNAEGDEFDAAVARYKEIYDTLAETTEDGLDEFRKKLKEGAVFDFGGEDNPIEAAKAFIQSLGHDSIQPALDAVKAQYDTEIAAIEEQRKILETQHNLGYINDSQYETVKGTLDELAELAGRRLEEQQKEINGSVADAINTIMEQAVQGYMDKGGEDDYEKMRGYADAVLNPLMQAIQDAFGEDALNTILSSGTGGGLADFLDLYMRNQIRESNNIMFQELENEGGTLWNSLSNYWKKELMSEIGNMFGPDVANTVTEAWNSTLDWANQSHAEGAGDYMPEIEYDVEIVEDPSVQQPIAAPGVDNTEFNRTINERVETARQASIAIQQYLSMMGGFAPFTGPMSGYRETSRPVIGYASGGFPRSGDLVMANENGNFEMMGRMGNQPVVANNQQIVDGIARGVSTANGNMVSEMRTMVTLMQRMLNKEFVAKAVPSSAWGHNNSKSADAYSKVTG